MFHLKIMKLVSVDVAIEIGINQEGNGNGIFFMALQLYSEIQIYSEKHTCISEVACFTVVECNQDLLQCCT